LVSPDLPHPITPFELLAVAAENYEACFVLETERKQKAGHKIPQSSEEEKEEEAREEAGRKLEAEVLWRWGLTLIKQSAYASEEDPDERERLLDLGKHHIKTNNTTITTNAD
jgi:dihydropteroate synthase